MTWRLVASGPPLTPRSVIGEGEAAGLILSSCLAAPGRQRGFWQHVPLCCPAYSGQDARVASQPGHQPPGPARRAAVRRSKGVIAWQPLQAPGRQPPGVRGSAAPGNYLAAAPKPRRVRLPGGWPVGQSSPRPPVVVVVSTLPPA